MADTYDIISQAPKMNSSGGGYYTQVTEVRFKTKPSGQIGTVEIPVQAFTLDEVARLVGAKAALIESVQKL